MNSLLNKLNGAMIRFFGIAGVILCVLTACGQSEIPNDKLVTAYSDYVVARYQIADSAALRATFDSIAVAHGFTPDEMQNELRAMSSNGKLMRAFYDKVAARLDSLRKASSSIESL
ncbi:MAG: hypothetical protein AMXMBFR68_12310 [Ignavibacteria bacterium]|nr:hypothetical protein [Chlorobiota bacterium]